jgi:hypothetical protein
VIHVVTALETQHDAPPTTSLQTGEMVVHAHQHLIAMGIDVEAPLLFQMPMTIMVTDDELGFILHSTSPPELLPNVIREWATS